MGPWGLDQLLALRWKLLHRPSPCVGQQPPASHNLRLGLHSRTEHFPWEQRLAREVKGLALGDRGGGVARGSG